MLASVTRYLLHSQSKGAFQRSLRTSSVLLTGGDDRRISSGTSLGIAINNAPTERHHHTLHILQFRRMLSNDTDASATREETESKPKRRAIVARKPAISLTPKSRKFFQALLEYDTRDDIAGIMLRYQQHGGGEPRMVFSFDFVTKDKVDPMDEPVSLIEGEDNASGSKFKIFVHRDAFMKVLGSTVDLNDENGLPRLLNRDGDELDPNF